MESLFNNNFFLKYFTDDILYTLSHVNSHIRKCILKEYNTKNMFYITKKRMLILRSYNLSNILNDSVSIQTIDYNELDILSLQIESIYIVRTSIAAYIIPYNYITNFCNVNNIYGSEKDILSFKEYNINTIHLLIDGYIIYTLDNDITSQKIVRDILLCKNRKFIMNNYDITNVSKLYKYKYAKYEMSRCF